MTKSVLDGVDGREYHGIWRAWKGLSLLLFAVFVGAFLDVARSIRRIERRTRILEEPLVSTETLLAATGLDEPE